MYSEEQLQLAIDTIPTLAWSARADGAAEFFNRHWLDYTGLSADQAREWGWTVALHPNDLSRWTTYWKLRLNSGESGEIEARLRRHDGEFHWFLFRTGPLRDESGRIVQWCGVNTDIDDRKRAEETLRRTEEKFRLLVDGIDAHIATMTSKGELEFVNERGLVYFGKTLEELKQWHTIVHPDDLHRVVTAWKHSVETGDPYDIDHRLRRSDGVYRWFHARGLGLRDAQSRILHWYVLLTDIEDRETARGKLLSAEAYLSEAQELSHTGSFGWDVDSGEIYWSRETFRIFEYDPSTRVTIELILQRIHPDDRSAVEQVIEQASSTRKQFDLEHRLLMPNGSIKHLRVVGRPWRNALGRLEFVGAVTDITELKLANEKLRHSEEYLLEAQRISQTGSYRQHIKSGAVAVSPEIYRMWGLTPDDDTSIAETFFSRIHPEDRDSARQLYERCIREKTVYESDYRIVLPDGTVKHLHAIGHPALNKSGELVEFSGTVIDVTERRHLERALQFERDRLRLLLDLNNRVASHLDLPQLFLTISTELRRVFKCDFVGLACPDPSGKYFRQMMVDYPESKGVFKEGGLYPIDASCSGVAFRTGKPFMIKDLSEGRPFWSRDKAFSKAVASEPFKSGCFLPMISAGEVLGVLQVTSLTERFFSHQDLEFLEQVAAQIAITLKNALQYEQANETKDRLHAENVVLREQIDQAFMFEEIVGSSSALQTVLSSIVKVGPTDSTVLITGETGTGKELIARAIHKHSQRSGRAFVSVNCASIPPSLIASELFGHEKGAFTGALQLRQGRFELAHSGTIFLDEVGELPAETQIALLRVLQERQFERVGGNRLLPADVRVIAATNRDLPAAIAAGAFRSDLFYRLNVFPIEVPPLRKRKEDIPMLVGYFVKRFGEKMGKHIRRIDKKTLELCQSYEWPGNIRELQNIVERSVILSGGDTFSIDDTWLPIDQRSEPGLSGPLRETLLDQEKKIIEAALAASRGKIAGANGAAARLGIPASTLDSKIKQLKIKRTLFATSDS